MGMSNEISVKQYSCSIGYALSWLFAILICIVGILIVQPPPLITFFILIELGLFILTLFNIINIRLYLGLIIFAIALSPKMPGPIPIRVEDLLMFPLVVFWLVRVVTNKISFPDTPFNGLIVALFTVSIVSTLVGGLQGTTNLLTINSYTSASLHLLKRLEVFLLFFIVVSAIKTRKSILVFVSLLIIASFALGVFGVLEYMISYGSFQGIYRISGPTGSMSEMNTMGVYYVFALLLILGLQLSKISGFLRIILGIIALPIIFSFIFGFSRSAYISMFFAILYLAIFKNKRLLIPIISLAILAPIILPETVLQRIESIKSVFNPHQSYALDYGDWIARVNSWFYHVPQVLLHRPILGYGMGSVPLAQIESEYVKELYYTGLVGLGIFIWLLIKVFVFCSTIKSRDNIFQGFSWGFSAGLVAFAVTGIAGATFTAVRSSEIFWFTAGLMVAYRRILLKEEGVVCKAA